MTKKSVVIALTKQLADKGLLLASGWQGLSLLIKDLPEEQRYAMRMAYCIGVQHLFSSLMNAVDESENDEPTVDDLMRMKLLDSEIEAVVPLIESWVKARQKGGSK